MKISYDDWHKRIESTLAWRMNHWNGDKAWKRYLALYRGDHWRTGRYASGFDSPDSDVPRDRITVNITGETVLLAKSFLLKQRPKFIINPRRPEDVVACLLKQSVLNYEWKEKDIQRAIRKAILDDIVVGHCVIKTGFTFREPTANKPTQEGNINYKPNIDEGSPYVDRVDPFMFLFDVEEAVCGDIQTGAWCAEIFFCSQEDLLANSIYNKKVLDNIKSGFENPEFVDIKLSSSSDVWNTDNAKRIVCYEVWDKKFSKYYIFAKGVEKPLLETDWPYEYLEGFPYEKTDFIPLINEQYGIGLPYYIEDQQLELNRIRTAMFDHRRRYNRKYMYLANSISPGELTKLLTGETGTAVEVNNMNALLPVPEMTVPSEAYKQEEVIKNDIRELTGVDQLVRGGSLPGRTSAAEIGARQQYTSLKLDDRVEDVDYFVECIGRKMLQHIEQNYGTEKVIKIAGPAGNYWVKYSKEDIQGEFDMEMETMSAPRIDETTDRQQKIQVFQMIMQALPVLQQAQVQIDFTELLKWMLASFNEKDMSRFFPAMGQIGAPIQTNTEAESNGVGNPSNLQTPSPPNVMNASDLRAGMQGGMSGGMGFNAPGVQ